MNIDPIAAPHSQSPELRYASLHRVIENGLATERTWAELIDICLTLDRKDEALRAHGHLRDPSLKRRKAHRLQSAGIRCEALREPRQPQPRASQAARPQQRTRPGAAPLSADFAEILGDSIRYLFLDHLPVTLIVATVTFPLVIGLGGFLSSAAGPSAYFALSLLALIPALSALGMVGALVRRVLIDSSRGIDDPPAIPTFSELCAEAMRFTGHAGGLAAILIGPGLAGLFIEPLGPIAPLLALAAGATLFPMALLLRELSGDWQSVRPGLVLGAIRKAGSRYFGLCGASALMLAPAVAALALTVNTEPYMAISVVGPLLVTPLFVVARMFGHLWSDVRRTSRIEQAATMRPTTGADDSDRGATQRGRRAQGNRLHTGQSHPESRAAAERARQAQPIRGERPSVPGADRARMPGQRDSGVGRKTGLRTRAEVTEMSGAAAGSGSRARPTPRAFDFASASDAGRRGPAPAQRRRGR